MADPPRGSFNYPTPYRLGCGRIRELADACRELEIERPLVVTDPGISALPWFGPIVETLQAAGLGAIAFTSVEPNPVEANVTAGVRAYHAGNHDGCVCIGGGSPLDVGKCVALMVGNPGSVFDYEDVGDNWKRVDPSKIPPMIAIPTTSGTGSEVGRSSAIIEPATRAKKIIFHPRMLPHLVIADPELTFGLPAHITAATGMDALAHCFEAYCATGYHPLADGIALEGMRLVHHNLVRCHRHGHDAEARTHMMVAASMGATAFQKGLGMVHALSHPLGGATGVHHGLANAIFLPYVMAYNRPTIEVHMGRISRHLELPAPGYPGVMEWMLELRSTLGLPHTLADVDGMSLELVPELAKAALTDPTLPTNPRPAGVDDLERVFRRALDGDLS